jgi:hypothetical protein
MLTESLLPAFAAAADFHLRLAGAPLPVAMALSMARQNFSSIAINCWRVHWPASSSPICQATMCCQQATLIPE